MISLPDIIAVMIAITFGGGPSVLSLSPQSRLSNRMTKWPRSTISWQNAGSQAVIWAV